MKPFYQDLSDAVSIHIAIAAGTIILPNPTLMIAGTYLLHLF
jgi:hypothetical protein